MPQNTIVIASSNKGKLREIQDILASLNVEVVTVPSEILDGIEETGATFAENALIKARAIAERTGRIAIADDSVLEVDALEGAPGVLSSRFAENDTMRVSKLLDMLEGVPLNERSARFRCSVAIASPSGKTAVTEGTAEGLISTEPKGENGFGYDPVFYYPSLGRTFAEMTAEEKRAVSHRGKALARLKELISEFLD